MSTTTIIHDDRPGYPATTRGLAVVGCAYLALAALSWWLDRREAVTFTRDAEYPNTWH